MVIFTFLRITEVATVHPKGTGSLKWEGGREEREGGTEGQREREREIAVTQMDKQV